jgi:hypothetical protein
VTPARAALATLLLGGTLIVTAGCGTSGHQHAAAPGTGASTAASGSAGSAEPTGAAGTTATTGPEPLDAALLARMDQAASAGASLAATADTEMSADPG